MAALEKSESQKSGLIERVQNLEIIVTSQEWDLLDPPALSGQLEASNKKKTTISLPSSEMKSDTKVDQTAEHAARLARRLNS